MSLFHEINSKYPIRQSELQKQNFADAVKSKITNRKVTVEKLENKHSNVIVGDIENADVILTAHYDTPKRSLFPNLMIPRNPVLCRLYHYGIFIGLALLSLLLARLISYAVNDNTAVFVLSYLVIYFSSFYVCTRLMVNKNNANDNTSGVVTLIEIARKTVSKKVAFVFFDNEEKGLLGSKAFNKQHKQILKDKLILNLDCVGLGKNFIFIAKPKAIEHKLYGQLKNACKNSDGYNFEFYPLKGSTSNSDYKNFDGGIGLSAYSKSKKGVYYTGKIHTDSDREIDNENINVLCEKLLKFIHNI